MKKGLKIAVSALLVLSLLAGCSSNKSEISSGMANAELFDNMKEGETVSAADVTKAFDDALDKTDAVDSITIDTEVNINLTENNETTSSKRTTQIKFQPNGDKQAAEETTQAQADDAESNGADSSNAGNEQAEVPNRTAYVNIKNEFGPDTETMEGYFKDDYLYYTIEEKPVKEPMAYTDLMYIVSDYSVHFDDNVIDTAFKVKSKNETQYTIKFDAAAMAEMMKNNMAGGGSPLGANENMSINEAYIYFVVDKDGYLTGFDMELDAKFIAPAAENTEEQTGDAAAETQTAENPFKYSIVANFSDINKTKVEPFADLDSYRDVNEVLAEMQAEQEAQEQAGSETVTKGEDTEQDENNTQE